MKPMKPATIAISGSASSFIKSAEGEKRSGRRINPTASAADSTAGDGSWPNLMQSAYVARKLANTAVMDHRACRMMRVYFIMRVPGAQQASVARVRMDTIKRRTFLSSAAGAAALSAMQTSPAAAASGSGGPVFIATWDFSKPAVERGVEILHSGGSLLDAIEKGINIIEDDPTITTVGYGGYPNAEGEVELDAGIMDGTRHRAGAVFNLHKIKNPISVARLVLDRTTHTQLVGDGALEFAMRMGFQPMQLLTPQSLEAWLKWKNTPNHETYYINKHNHDTIGVCATDGKGKVAAGCSTSGIAWKIPGRVADSPIVGAGYMADDTAGAASATGNGDVMTNYCTSAYLVNKMRDGLHPQEACEDLMRMIARTAPNVHTDMYCAIALSPRGEVGAASINAKQQLTYVVWRNGAATIHTAKAVFP